MGKIFFSFFILLLRELSFDIEEVHLCIEWCKLSNGKGRYYFQYVGLFVCKRDIRIRFSSSFLRTQKVSVSVSEYVHRGVGKSEG